MNNLTPTQLDLLDPEKNGAVAALRDLGNEAPTMLLTRELCARTYGVCLSTVTKRGNYITTPVGVRRYPTPVADMLASQDPFIRAMAHSIVAHATLTPDRT